jgi:hypothetical protein
MGGVENDYFATGTAYTRVPKPRRDPPPDDALPEGHTIALLDVLPQSLADPAKTDRHQPKCSPGSMSPGSREVALPQLREATLDLDGPPSVLRA